MIPAVLDTNIFCAAIFENDIYAKRVINAVIQKQIELVISEPIKKEIKYTVMKHAIEAGLTLRQTQRPLEKIMKLLSNARCVNPTFELKVTVHEADNKFYECAYEADVTAIISVDSHVSAPSNIRTCNGHLINTYSPWQFIQQFKITG